MDDVGSLIWSLLVIVLAGGVLVLWNAQLPEPLLWVGFVGMLAGAGMLVRWWSLR